MIQKNSQLEIRLGVFQAALNVVEEEASAVRARLAESDASVAGNPVLLTESLNNLIDNALRYTPAGGSATVRCGMRSSAPFFSVEDSGPGIPDWAHDRVFEHYVRMLERHPERLELEQSHLFAAMEHAYRKSDMNALLRVNALTTRLEQADDGRADA